MWILVVSPPRERPSACSTFFWQLPKRAGVHAPPYCPNTLIQSPHLLEALQCCCARPSCLTNGQIGYRLYATDQTQLANLAKDFLCTLFRLPLQQTDDGWAQTCQVRSFPGVSFSISLRWSSHSIILSILDSPKFKDVSTLSAKVSSHIDKYICQQTLVELFSHIAYRA